MKLKEPWLKIIQIRRTLAGAAAAVGPEDRGTSPCLQQQSQFRTVKKDCSEILGLILL